MGLYEIRYRTRALADMEGIYQYLEPRSPTGARNVLRPIHRAVDLIGREPLRGVRTSDQNLRVKVLGGYRYKTFYAVIADDTVEIVHVRHTARRPWP